MNGFTLILLVAIKLIIQNDKKHLKMTETTQKGTYLRVLSERILMNANMAWFQRFSKFFADPCALNAISRSIGRVKETC